MIRCRECRRLAGHMMNCGTGRSGGCVRCERVGSHHDEVTDHYFCEEHAGPLAMSEREIDTLDSWLLAQRAR